MALISGSTAAMRKVQPNPTNGSARQYKVVLASSLGTIFEWYDFYLYGSLAPIIARQFFVGEPGETFIFALLTFAAGFIVRPIGALVFGRLGDMAGRKTTFLVTITLMGSATFLVGLLPGHAAIGIAAPIMLVTLRLLQGLALGGEYGGAAIYVAEHAPRHRRGAFTAWIQATATLGFLLSLMVILGTRVAIGEEAFAIWGWRVPFLVSIVLLVISVWIRLAMDESPVFAKMKADGKASRAPLTEAFGRWRQLKVVILALVGLTAGQAVVWYTGQFHALFFMIQTLKVDMATANILMASAIVLALPFFIIFGALSDRIGRKPIILTGCLLAALTYFPIFGALTHYANPALESALRNSPIVLVADPDSCHFQLNLTGTRKFPSSCDIAAQALSAVSVNYTRADGLPGSIASIELAGNEIVSFDADLSADGLDFSAVSKEQEVQFKKALGAAIKAALYPLKAQPKHMNKTMLILLLFLLMLYVTMVYGPIAAMLAEMFPTRIRYTAMSLPYHLGNGWFGGSLPAMAFALVAFTGDIYSGLWYPVLVALATVTIGALFITENRNTDFYSDH
jgi:MFS family permease